MLHKLITTVSLIKALNLRILQRLWIRKQFVNDQQHYLKEGDMVLGLRELSYFSVSFLQLCYLLLQLLKKCFSLAHCRPLLTPDQLRHFSAPALYGAHQLCEDALALLEGRLCGELRGDKRGMIKRDFGFKEVMRRETGFYWSFEVGV